MRDVVGAGLSVLCMLHCLLPIVLVSSGASLGLHEVASSMHSEWLHFMFLLPIIGLLIYSLPRAYNEHKNPVPAVTAFVGSLLLIIAIMLGGDAETLLTMTGSVFVIGAHLINRREIKSLSTAAA